MPEENIQAYWRKEVVKAYADLQSKDSHIHIRSAPGILFQDIEILLRRVIDRAIDDEPRDLQATTVVIGALLARNFYIFSDASTIIEHAISSKKIRDISSAVQEALCKEDYKNGYLDISKTNSLQDFFDEMDRVSSRFPQEHGDWRAWLPDSISTPTITLSVSLGAIACTPFRGIPGEIAKMALFSEKIFETSVRRY